MGRMECEGARWEEWSVRVGRRECESGRHRKINYNKHFP